MESEKVFPLQASNGRPAPLKIPWSIAEKAYSQYVFSYGRGQSLERIAQRGGFSALEMDELFPGWENECSEIKRLQSRISSLEAALSLDDENVERYRKELEIYAGDIRHVITGIRRRVGLEVSNGE